MDPKHCTDSEHILTHGADDGRQATALGYTQRFDHLGWDVGNLPYGLQPTLIRFCISSNHRHSGNSTYQVDFLHPSTKMVPTKKRGQMIGTTGRSAYGM